VPHILSALFSPHTREIILRVVETAFLQVRFESGERLDYLELRSILQILPVAKESWNTPAYLNAGLMDIMGRYGTVAVSTKEAQVADPHPHPDIQKADVADVDVPATPPGEAEGEQGSGVVAFGELSEVTWDPDAEVVVRLRIRSARGIGMVDLQRGADLFCVAFVGDWRAGQNLRGEHIKGNRLFQTEVCRGKTEEDWTWDKVTAPL
jgi:hypothetical protein